MEQLLRQTNAQGRSDKQETGSKSCEAAPKIAQRSVHGDYARNFTRTTTMDNPAMVQKKSCKPPFARGRDTAEAEHVGIDQNSRVKYYLDTCRDSRMNRSN